MDDKKIIVNTQGGTVITGGTFSNVEFVAQKNVFNAKNKLAMYDGIKKNKVNINDLSFLKEKIYKKKMIHQKNMLWNF